MKHLHFLQDTASDQTCVPFVCFFHTFAFSWHWWDFCEGFFEWHNCDTVRTIRNFWTSEEQTNFSIQVRDKKCMFSPNFPSSELQSATSKGWTRGGKGRQGEARAGKGRQGHRLQSDEKNDHTLLLHAQLKFLAVVKECQQQTETLLCEMHQHYLTKQGSNPAARKARPSNKDALASNQGSNSNPNPSPKLRMWFNFNPILKFRIWCNHPSNS